MEFLFSGFADEAGNTIEEQMDVFDKNGFKYIEMRNVDGKHVLQWDDEALRVIKEKMDKRGFNLSAVGSPIGKSKIEEPFDDVLSSFKKAVHVAKFFGCKYIRAFSFFTPKDKPREDYFNEAVSRVKKLVAVAEENGVVYALENESGVFADTLVNCLKFFNEIDSPAIRLAFDPGNFVLNGVNPHPDVFKALGEKIGYFHIKDADGDKFVASGEGKSNMSNLLKEVYGSGFNGFLSVEPHLGYLKDLTKAQQFTTACNALKKCLNEGVGTSFEMVDLSTV